MISVVFGIGLATSSGKMLAGKTETGHPFPAEPLAPALSELGASFDVNMRIMPAGYPGPAP